MSQNVHLQAQLDTFEDISLSVSLYRTLTLVSLLLAGFGLFGIFGAELIYDKEDIDLWVAYLTVLIGVPSALFSAALWLRHHGRRSAVRDRAEASHPGLVGRLEKSRADYMRRQKVHYAEPPLPSLHLHLVNNPDLEQSDTGGS